MKHGIPKGDKKKKKDVMAEIAVMLSDLDLKHEKELRELEVSFKAFIISCVLFMYVLKVITFIFLNI